MRIRLITVVWGEEYVDTFIRAGLRSLLSEGNARDLAAAHQVVYTIYTTPRDARTLERAPIFARLRQQVDVRISLFGPGEIDMSNYGEHGTFWWRGIELARRNDEVVFFIIPDLIYANGTLLRWAQRLADGKRAIFTVGPQVALETVLPELENRFPGDKDPYDLDRDRLLDLLCRHMHPLHAAMRHDVRRRPHHPEYDTRLVPGRGMIIREIVSHPFCVDPSFYSALRHYGPLDHLDTVAFEPCSTVSAEPILKRVYGYYRPWPLDETRLSNLAGWWDCFTTAACERESNYPFEIARQDDGEWRSGRSRAVAAGGFYRSQIIAAGKLYQLFVALKTHGHFHAANILAAAAYAGRLRRHIGVRRRAVVLVPTDEALSGTDGKRVKALLLPGRESDLLELICDHILLPASDLSRARRHSPHPSCTQWAGEELVTASGLPAAPLLERTRSAGETIIVGPFTIHPVSTVVWRQAIKPRVAGERRRPADGQAANGTVVVTRWAQQSSFHRALYHALHVPFVEPFVALLFPVYFRNPIKDPNKTDAFAQWLTDSAETLNWANLKRSLVQGMRRSLLVRGYKKVGRTLSPLRLGLLEIKTHGIRFATRVACARAITRVLPYDTAMRVAIRPSQVEELNEVRNYRALKAVEEILADFEAKMATGHFRSAPLAYVRRLLAACKLKGDSGTSAARRLLLKGIMSHPTWSEAWLELGFLYEDDGAPAVALQCFERAMHAMRATDVSPTDPDPRAVAAANHGRLLAAMGRVEAACVSLAHSIDLDHTQKMAAALYAGLLRQQGEIDRALVYYGEGMYHQECRWCLPPAPRDCGELGFQYLAAEQPVRSTRSVPLQANAGVSLNSELSYPQQGPTAP